MTDHDLSDLLDRLGERAPVGPPPTAAMLAAATRARRRRTTWLAAGTAAAVAATIGGVTMLGDSSEPARHRPADPSPTSVVTPPGTRLVGMGHIAASVPEGWGTNRLYCSTVVEDSVVIDIGGFDLCDAPYPEGVDSVWFGTGGEHATLEDGEPVDFDGLAAERTATTCEAGSRGVTVCSASIYFPEEDVQIKAESSTSRAEVDHILSWIRIVPDQVAVPGFSSTNMYHQDDNAVDHYLAELEKLGLRVEVVAKQDRIPKEGYILGVEPEPGTMVAPGSVVTVTEVAAPN